MFTFPAAGKMKQDISQSRERWAFTSNSYTAAHTTQLLSHWQPAVSPTSLQSESMLGKHCNTSTSIRQITVRAISIATTMLLLITVTPAYLGNWEAFTQLYSSSHYQYRSPKVKTSLTYSVSPLSDHTPYKFVRKVLFPHSDKLPYLRGNNHKSACCMNAF